MVGSGKRLTSLVVDDEVLLRSVIQIVLKNMGHEVFGAENGVRGFRLAAVKRPDLAVIDIRLPDFDGIELLRRMKQELSLDCPVLMMTGHASVDSAVASMKLGASNYLKKPFSIKDFKKAIDEVTGQTTQGTSSGSLESAVEAAIVKAMNLAEGNKRKAAKILGISKTTLYTKLDKYEIY